MPTSCLTHLYAVWLQITHFVWMLGSYMETSSSGRASLNMCMSFFPNCMVNSSFRKLPNSASLVRLSPPHQADYPLLLNTPRTYLLLKTICMQLTSWKKLDLAVWLWYALHKRFWWWKFEPSLVDPVVETGFIMGHFPLSMDQPPDIFIIRWHQQKPMEGAGWWKGDTGGRTEKILSCP